MSKSVSDEDLRERLTSEQYHVTQEGGTERAFSGCYWNEKRPGIYSCVVCGEELFRSDTKYESGSGWPSFWTPIEEQRIAEVEDLSHGMRRIEVRCNSCGSHLGHVFPDGPRPTGLRYCINSASLDFRPNEPAE